MFITMKVIINVFIHLLFLFEIWYVLYNILTQCQNIQLQFSRTPITDPIQSEILLSICNASFCFVYPCHFIPDMPLYSPNQSA
jgi:hypothetical protein